MMRNDTHLSEEAVAACADGVLSGMAQERANRHIASCAECAHAVKVQREAVWVLRAAPAPPLPAGLFERLKEVPLTTPIRTTPTAIGPDGSAVLPNFAPMAAFAPSQSPSPLRRENHRVRNVVLTAAAVTLAGAVAAGSVAQTSSNSARPGTGRLSHPGSTTRGPQPVHVFRELGR